MTMPTTQKTKRTPRPSTPRARRTPKLPTENDIAERAYQLFIMRGCEHGRDLDDWLSAKRELLSPEA